MESTEQQLILGLSERLRQAQPAHKDPHAAELIQRHIAGQPDAIYLLTQAVLIQEDALRNAQTKITELEQRPATLPPPAPPAPATPGVGFLSRGGMLSGVFGRAHPNAPGPAPTPTQAPVPAPQQAPGGGSSFLKTAAVAAAGVAGGGLLLSGLSNVLAGHHSAPEAHHHTADHQDGDDDGDWDDDSNEW